METDLTTPLPELNSITESGNSFDLNSKVNIWNDSCQVLTIPAELVHKYLYSSADVFLSTILMPIAIGLGCFLNGSFLYVVACIKTMQTTTNFYLANLAVCDGLYLLFSSYEIRAYVVSGTVSRNTVQDGHISCVMIVLQHIFYVASLAFIILVTTERFFAICYPIKSLPLNRRKRTVKLAVAAWLISLIIGILYTMQSMYVETVCVNWPDEEGFTHLPKVVGWCSGSLIPKHFTLFSIVIRGCKALTFGIPFLLCSFMCIKIVTALGKRPIPSSKSHAVGSSQAERARLHVTKMLLINNAVFFVCNIPSTVVHVCRFSALVTGVSTVPEDVLTTLVKTAIVCTLINSAVNPIIYNGSNPRYRQAFRQAFTACLRCRRDGNIEQQTSHQLSIIDQRGVATSISKIEDAADK